MLDKKKVWGLAVLALGVVIVLTVILTLSFARGGGSPQAEKAQPDSTAISPSAEATPSAVKDPALTLEEKQLINLAASAAASYSNDPKSAMTPAQYVAAGFSDDLAKSYRPIWYGLFAGHKEQARAKITANVEGEEVASPKLTILDVQGTVPGSQTYRVAADVAWVPRGVTPAKGQQMGVYGQQSGNATWILTYDQMAKRVTAIQQPAWQELDAERLFKAMGVPVPPTTPKK